MSAYNFVRSGRNFTKFFCLTPKRSFSSTLFRFCCYLHRYQRYLQFRNFYRFWTFFTLTNFKGGRCYQNLYLL